MNNKRTLVISIVAVLVVLAGFLAYTRSTESAQPIPVTGLSNSGASQPNQIAKQNQAANSSVTNNRESAEQIQAQQGLQALKDQVARGFIRYQSTLPVKDLNKSYSTRGYIRFQSSGGQ